MRCAYASSPSFSCSLSPMISSIQPESKKLNLPLSGIFTKWRYKNGFLFSSSVGAAMDATLKNLGSMFLIIWPISEPLPAVPHPSTSTSTGSPCSFTLSCCSCSFLRASCSRSSSFASDGRSVFSHCFNMQIPPILLSLVFHIHSEISSIFNYFS